MKNAQPKLKLIKVSAIKGYTISNIKEVLGEKEYKRFKKWIYGQTVGIYKEEDLIYRHDYESFLAGLPPVD